MKVLALDFDGVICNSSREVFLVTLRSYAQLSPGSPVARRFAGLALDRPGGLESLQKDPVYQRFRELIPLGNRAEDYGVAFRALDSDISITDQDEYDSFFALQDRAWLDEFDRAFYAERERLRAGDTGRWLALHSPYRRLIDLLRRRAGAVTRAVVTAKDRRSVELLLSHFEISDLIDGELILDKECGADKSNHLLRLAALLRAEPGMITFIDDKVNHLERVAPVGVRPVLASWGYNTPREHARARRIGFAVATLDNAESILFNPRFK